VQPDVWPLRANFISFGIADAGHFHVMAGPKLRYDPVQLRAATPVPMWHNEIRSLAPRTLPYERALLATTDPPAIKAAELDKNVLRLIFVFELLTLFFRG
jgi:hypothetical protein